MAAIKLKGHRLETISTRGGTMAACSCGEGYNATPKRQVFEVWEKDKLKALHEAHKASLL